MTSKEQMNKAKKLQRSTELARIYLEEKYGDKKVDWARAIKKAQKIKDNTAFARSYLLERYQKRVILEQEPEEKRPTAAQRIVNAIRRLVR